MDVLEKIFRENRGGQLEQFFALYGAAEASAMCYFLATAKNKNEVKLQSQPISCPLDDVRVPTVPPNSVRQGQGGAGVYLQEGRADPGCCQVPSNDTAALHCVCDTWCKNIQ